VQSAACSRPRAARRQQSTRPQLLTACAPAGHQLTATWHSLIATSSPRDARRLEQGVAPAASSPPRAALPPDHCLRASCQLSATSSLRAAGRDAEPRAASRQLTATRQPPAHCYAAAASSPPRAHCVQPADSPSCTPRESSMHAHSHDPLACAPAASSLGCSTVADDGQNRHRIVVITAPTSYPLHYTHLHPPNPLGQDFKACSWCQHVLGPNPTQFYVIQRTQVEERQHMHVRRLKRDNI
jgi:hypothetical protein